MNTSLNKNFTFISIAIIIVAGLLAYGNSMQGQFLYDDDTLILNNAFIRNIPAAMRFFKANIEAGAGQKSAFWRPFQMISYASDYQFWKLAPAGYHITNIRLHILVGVSA